jgi:hypothetical protein
MTETEHFAVGMAWRPERPHILVAACSDGRLQEATDLFLSRSLGVRHYDRLYAPGGAGALSSSGRDFMRSHQLRQECRYLVDAHQVESLILIYHGPAPDGPTEACCVDYRRKLPWASDAQLREQQEKDAQELLAERWQWAGKARVSIYRCEVSHNGELDFVTLHLDPGSPNASREG